MSAQHMALSVPALDQDNKSVPALEHMSVRVPARMSAPVRVPAPVPRKQRLHSRPPPMPPHWPLR